MELPRLDILLYAHDGRGLGHASRTIAVGMALRRLFPALRVLFVSGCRVSQELIGPAALDWLKLPSYETEVVGGSSRGIDGNSGYSDRQLGELRAAQLAQIVTLYRPRLVLADHTPQGKHRELLPALAADRPTATRWLLGVRGVVGAVAQAQSELACRTFADHYHGLFWYGDAAVLGGDHLALLKSRYGVSPTECGYVSRLRELLHWRKGIAAGDGGRLAGTISVPWLGEHTLGFLRALAGALWLLGPEHGCWKLFCEPGRTPAMRAEIDSLFTPLPHCRPEPLAGPGYVEALLQSRTAVIFGGYNSIMDVLACSLPSVVVLREMRDREQQLHLDRLHRAAGELLQVVEEAGVTAEELARLLLANLAHSGTSHQPINLDGAERTAEQLGGLLAATPAA